MEVCHRLQRSGDGGGTIWPRLVCAHEISFLTPESNALSESRWLIIFDNVEQSTDLDDFWPSSGNGQIIVTTQKPDIGFNLTQSEIVIHPFDTKEGRGCIVSLLSWAGGIKSDSESADALNEELGGLPLGIVHMTAQIRQRKWPIRKFLVEYLRNKSVYHDREAKSIVGVMPKTKPMIGTNWKTAFGILDTAPDSKSFLGVLSLFAADKIPQTIFNHWEGGKTRVTRGLLPFCDTVDECIFLFLTLINVL
jgi:hypothetical protein